MENDIFMLIKSLSIETIIISIIVVIITGFVKVPIKKITSKYTSDKEKSLNTLITAIPLFISSMLTFIYLTINKTAFSFNKLTNCSISSWIISLSLYAIYEKTKIFIKGFISGNLDENSINGATIIASKLLKQLTIDEKDLTMINKELIKLYKVKENNISNLEKLSNINIEINKLKTKEKQLKKEINSTKNKIQ